VLQDSEDEAVVDSPFSTPFAVSAPGVAYVPAAVAEPWRFLGLKGVRVRVRVS
jgi:hypothetical protein